MADGPDTPLNRFLAWFPSGKDDPKGWRFDVITLLAIIGEGSVAEHAQTISASALCLLPRIIPAPQALLKPIRPQRLPEVTAKMAGVYGGVVLDTVGFFANIIHPLDELKPFAFRVIEIKHKHLIEAPETPLSPGWKNLPFKRGGWTNFISSKKKSGAKKSHPHGGIPTSPAGTGMGPALLLSTIKESEAAGGEKGTVKEQHYDQEDIKKEPATPSPPHHPPSLSQISTLASDLKHHTHLDDIKSASGTETNDSSPVTATIKHKEDNSILTPITPTPTPSVGPPPPPPLPSSQSQSRRPQTTPLQTNPSTLHLRPRKTTTFSLTQQQHRNLEAGQGVGLQRAATISEKFSDMLTNPTMVNSQDRYTVPPTFYSPLHIISILSFFLTIGLLVASILWKDGTAIVAILMISLASSVVGYASYWRPLLMNRRTTNKVPRGDVVIRTREGAFVLIKCTEEVARELYSGTEECQYVVSTKFYRAFMGLGIILLMISVVLLGNCTWESQAFIGASYIVLNGAYWALGLLPHKLFWDLGRYKCVDITPKDAQKADEPTSDDPREGTPSFTRTLWYAIRETKHGAWVDRSGALPGTEQWRRWRDEAVQAARKGDRGWKAVGRKNEIMKEEIDAWREANGFNNNEDGMEEAGDFDVAEQKAPLVQVQGPVRAPTFG